MNFIEIFKNDDSNAFNRVLARINVKNAEKYQIPKLMVSVGEIVKTYFNPVFPLDVILTANESKKLNYNNDFYYAIFDKYGRKHTFKKAITVKAHDEAVPSGDSTVLSDSEINGNVSEIIIDDDLAIPYEDITIEFNVSPSSLSQLDDDIQLESRITGMASDIQSHEGLIEGFDTRLSALGKTVADNFLILDGKINDNTTIIGGLSTQLNSLNKTVEDNYLILDGKIDDNSGLINGLDTRLSALGKTTLDSLLLLADKIDLNSGMITELDTRLSALGSTVSSDINILEGRINDNSGLIAEINTTLSALGSTVSDNYDSLDTLISNHKADKNNPHEVTKAQIGLGNVNNTSDLNKPISTAMQEALEILDGKIDDNSGLITEINTTLSALGDLVDINSGLISGLDTRLSALGTSVNGILNTLDGLETALHTINSGNN